MEEEGLLLQQEAALAAGGCSCSRRLLLQQAQSMTALRRRRAEQEGIRLRVRAEYCRHDAILNQNVLSIKQDPLEKQFDLFSQSNTVLKSRDLGSIICDIKFSELSYLDAFWTDYMNGSLLEALKGVFITDSLKEAVGQETIQLLVNVDEDDYEEGRRMLLESFPQRAD